MNKSESEKEGKEPKSFRKIDHVLKIITLFIVSCSLIVFIWSVTVANKSLREAIKTRQNTLLPIIVVSDQDAGSFVFENCGYGITHKFRITITGSENTYESKQILKVGETLRIYYPKEWKDVIFDKKLSQAQLTIIYYDVFNRAIETRYDLKKLYNPRKECWQLLVDFQSGNLKIP